ncbi:glycosyltransferase [Labilibacter sediminis]|nr:glycosyltransferase [Labilibacter sediminis]
MPKYSIIIPVYNRPQEIDELLESLTHINYSDFEVIVIEDGSNLSAESICLHYKDKFVISYFFQDNTGPGFARNLGAQYASGEYLVFFDSDCLIPSDYFIEVDKLIDQTDSFGGPDKANDSFNTIQKAISYSMTSTLTTGGIRGGKKKLDKFYPRSFNFGIKREVFNKLKGFAKMRFGEDLDFSMRIIESGYKTMLIDDAWVFHKRRNTFKSFFKQVYNSGIARIHLEHRHPGTIKLLHWMPAAFTVGYPLWTILSLFIPHAYILLAIPPLTLFIDALLKTKEITTSLVAIVASFTQLGGYGSGFLGAYIKRNLLKKEEYIAFEDTFYE